MRRLGADDQRTRTLTERGASTRRRLLDSGEKVFGRLGYHDASISELTRGAGVALGTFYLYFESKHALLRALVLERGHEMRAVMAKAAAAETGRVHQEMAGFRAFLAWIGRHRALYSVVRQAEFIDRDLFVGWHRSLADGYARGLRVAAERGEIAPVEDPETLAYALMGAGNFVGMRWLLWEDCPRMPGAAERTLLDFVRRGLRSPDAGGASAEAVERSAQLR
jgi:AcrR family transcriptional regulator